jgi:hypothetical protein
MTQPRFYFTVHGGDMIRGRLLKDCHIMVVASAFWDNERKRFKVSRPPAAHIATMCIDSGGFTAMKRWGKYPWTPQQYAAWCHEMARDVPLDFVAIMDYACEPGVDRSAFATNKERIKATIRNDIACHESDPALPWLSVLQGDTLEERAFDLRIRKRLGLLPADYAGIGSVCGRGIAGAREAIRFYVDHLPGVRFHVFGMHAGTIDDDDVYAAVQSWDSYGWSWSRGRKNVDRPLEYYHREGESWSEYSLRLASLYWQSTIKPRLTKTRQLPLPWGMG